MVGVVRPPTSTTPRPTTWNRSRRTRARRPRSLRSQENGEDVQHAHGAGVRAVQRAPRAAVPQRARRTVAGDGTGHREKRDSRQDGGARAAEGRNAYGEREHARTHDGLDEVRSGRREARLALVLHRRRRSNQRRRPQHRARSGEPRLGVHLQRSDAAESEHTEETAHDGPRHCGRSGRDLAGTVDTKSRARRACHGPTSRKFRNLFPRSRRASPRRRQWWPSGLSRRRAGSSPTSG